jgi:hypothetical protein
MSDPFTRRMMLGKLGSGLALGGATIAAPAASMEEAGAARGGPPLVNVVERGADRTGQTNAAPAFQQAIDAVAPTGGIVYVPAGHYRIDETLLWLNRENARAPGILFQGDGMHSTVLSANMRSAPVLRVRGVRQRGPVDTSFFWGGGLRDLTIRGNGGEAQHGLEVLGWYYGEIQNCHFVGLGGDGIRAVTDLSVSPNPDFTSSTLFLRGVWFERLGGWGFLDMSDYQGAPAWAWDRCAFLMCRKGGAHVRSGGQSFTTCSFALGGWLSESEPPAASGYGLYFDGSATACSQQWIEGCEFDTNLTAHVGARFLAASSFLNNRFIFSDRTRSGRMLPPVGIAIGLGDVNATILGVQFRQNFFRLDLPGRAVAFDFVNHANVRDVEIGGSVFTSPAGAELTRYRGQDPGGRGAAYGYVVHDSFVP